MDMERLNAFVEVSPDATVCVTPGGEIVAANARVEQLLGYLYEELIGMQVEELVPQDKRARHVDQRERFNTRPRSRPMGLGVELQAQHRDGTLIPVEIMLHPLGEEYQGVVVASIRDITHRKRQAEERQRFLEQAKRLTDQKDEFIAIVSHQVKTPAATIMAFVDLLIERRDMPEEMKITCLQSIKRQAESLDEVLDQVTKMLGSTLVQWSEDARG
jgi:PAS domain S-box-containing protein